MGNVFFELQKTKVDLLALLIAWTHFRNIVQRYHLEGFIDGKMGQFLEAPTSGGVALIHMTFCSPALGAEYFIGFQADVLEFRFMALAALFESV